MPPGPYAFHAAPNDRHRAGGALRQRVLELVGPGAAQTRLQAVAATRGLSLFVGRDAQRAELESALEHALAGNGQAVGIVGDPGVGKSRLVHEFVAGCATRGVPVTATGDLLSQLLGRDESLDGLETPGRCASPATAGRTPSDPRSIASARRWRACAATTSRPTPHADRGRV
jgi:hypothetical protein